MNLPEVPEYQQAEFNKFYIDETMRTSGLMYNRLVELCFDKCVANSGWSGGLLSKNLDEKESKCLLNCATKMFKTQVRTGIRMQEYYEQQGKVLAAAAAASSNSK